VKCKHPFRRGLLEAGCGRCLPCRINRQRLWCIRLVLEAGQHPHNSFVTLTYDAEHYPASGCVSVREAQLFLKRLRQRVGSFRYYLVGEYGERTWRAHYHALLFGLRDGSGVSEAWGQGRVHVSGVGPESAAYVAGYCLKGLHNEKGMRWAGLSLTPEFCLMSRKPGIGSAAADRIGSFLSSSAAVASQQMNVPSVVRQSQKLWPLGRYLKARVAAGCGIDKDSAAEVRQLREAEVLKGMGQIELNEWIEHASGVSEQSGFRASTRAKRMSLERRTKL